MLNTEIEKIIYKKIANQRLDFWCKIDLETWCKWYVITDEKIIEGKWDYLLCIDEYPIKITNIIWHPVMLSDVINFIYSKQTWLDWKDKDDFRRELLFIVNEWIYKQDPIEKQMDECIEFVLYLIDKYN